MGEQGVLVVLRVDVIRLVVAMAAAAVQPVAVAQAAVDIPAAAAADVISVHPAAVAAAVLITMDQIKTIPPDFNPEMVR